MKSVIKLYEDDGRPTRWIDISSAAALAMLNDYGSYISRCLTLGEDRFKPIEIDMKSVPEHLNVRTLINTIGCMKATPQERTQAVIKSFMESKVYKDIISLIITDISVKEVMMELIPKLMEIANIKKVIENTDSSVAIKASCFSNVGIINLASFLGDLSVVSKNVCVGEIKYEFFKVKLSVNYDYPRLTLIINS